MRFSGVAPTSRLALGIMLAVAALVGIVWTTDPRQPVVGFLGGFLEPLLYLLLIPLPLAWVDYCFENEAVGDGVRVLVFAALVPANSYFLAWTLGVVRKVFSSFPEP
jgi:hypothetical protein